MIYETNELYHYGVKGMRWGHRKRYITYAQGMKRAKAASQDAWRKTTVENGGTLIGKNKAIAKYPNTKDKLQGKKAARTAYNNARKQSIADSKAYNKELRAERKAERNTPEAKAKRAKAMKIGAAAAGTALAAYGAYKVSKMLKNEAATRSYESGKKYAERYFRDADKYSKLGRFDIETNLLKAYRNTLKNTDRRTAKVSKSTVEAIKYLRHPERYIV